MPNWLNLTIEDLTAKIRRTLGEVKDDNGVVCVSVEISNEQINDCICDALRHLSRQAPRREFVSYAASTGTRSIELEDVGMGIFQVQPQGRAQEASELLGGGFGFQIPMSSPNELDLFAQGSMYMDLQRRQLGVDFQWKVVGTTLLLDDVPDGTSKLSVEFGRPYETVDSVPINWQEWMEKFAVALCRLQLGELRSKFSGIPAAGGQITLNGDSLIQQANQDLERLRQEVRDRNPMEAPLEG